MFVYSKLVGTLFVHLLDSFPQSRCVVLCDAFCFLNDFIVVVEAFRVRLNLWFTLRPWRWTGGWARGWGMGEGWGVAKMNTLWVQ